MNFEEHGRPIEILLVEDNPGDVRLTIEALKEGKVRNNRSVANDLHANCYITKPVDLEQFFSVVRSIDDFWLSVVRLPPKA